MAKKYTGKITNYHATKPKFYAHVDLSTRPLADISKSISLLINEFDLDSGVGVQLDVLGEWIGISRAVVVPVTGVFFEWDKERVGWNEGVWVGPYQSTDGLKYLNDAVYRVILKTKIGINNWNGQNDTLPPILETALSDTGIEMIILDNQDMSISVLIVFNKDEQGLITKFPEEIMAVLRGGLLTVKAAGVRVKETITPSEGDRFFGFDTDNKYIAGFDKGSWGDKF